RGVRGAEYAFANSTRLQKRLGELGMRYLHCRELAATPALRQRQAEVDKAEGTTKRKRLALGEAFIAGYREERLAGFDSRRCVERLIETIHRVMSPAVGCQDKVLDGLAQAEAAGGLYVANRTDLPPRSKVFGKSDRALLLHFEGKRLRYRYPTSDGGHTLTFV